MQIQVIYDKLVSIKQDEVLSQKNDLLIPGESDQSFRD